MRLIEESNNIRYYSGFDIDEILNHPDDGSNGVMVVFFDSLQDEYKRYNRSTMISNILEGWKFENFNTLIEELNNTYLILYQTSGYTDIVFRSIRNRIENIKDHNFESPWRAIPQIIPVDKEVSL